MKPHLVNLGQIGNAGIGFLTVAEGRALPFVVKRVYWSYQVPGEVLRGHHAHRELEQLIVAVAGVIEFELENGAGQRTVYRLDNPGAALYIPRLHWRTIRFSADAVLLCLASLEYDEHEYIRDYEEFKHLAAAANHA